MPSCPGMTLDFTVPVTAQIPYRTFNPQRQGSSNQYFFSSYSNYFCAGAPFYPPSFNLGGVVAYTDSLATYSLLNDQPPQANFQIDVTLLSGQFELSNGKYSSGNVPVEVPIGKQTTYDFGTEQSDEYLAPDNPDFNFDGETDHVSEPGSIDQESAGTTPLYGVWFSVPDDGTINATTGLVTDADGESIEPDLVRVAQQAPNFQNIGLLTQISEEDIANTDIYVFRESTGELVVEKEPFTLGRGTGTNGVSTDINGGYFELTIPGRDGQQAFQFFSIYSGQYEDWQASMDVSDAFQGDVDSLRVGEPIRVVAINRATGYVGSVLTNISVSGGLSGVTVPDLVLYPPNLKVEVTRKYEVEYGLTQGEERQYSVGFEGAALHGDQYLSVHTEWLDSDDMQLPSSLPGLTGRLSALVGENALDSAVNHFEIKPGKHIEVLNLNNGTAGVGASHQYFHIVGENTDGEIDFGSTGSDELQYRPAKPVPVMVAVYDEKESRLLKQAQFNLEDENIEQDSSVYQWVYRPEMVYSVYELDVENITRITGDGETYEISESQSPVIGSGDTTLEIASIIESSEFDSLGYFGPDTELIYSVEEYQSFARSGTSEINNVSFINNLSGDDYLSLNLLNNQDGGNILWEWAFEYLYLIITEEDEFNELAENAWYVTADNPIVKLSAGVIGGRSAEEETRGLRWYSDGNGAVRKNTTIEEGQSAYANQVEMHTTAGSRARVSVSLLEDGSVKTNELDIVVIPGQPAQISIKEIGAVGSSGTESMQVVATVKDQHGNTVLDGTPVAFHASGYGNFDGNLGYTAGGVVSMPLVGGFRSDGTRSYTVNSGDVVEERQFTISDPFAQIIGLPSSGTRGSRNPFTVRVTGPSGNPAAGVFVSVAVSDGILQYTNEQFVTNEDGELPVTWWAPERVFERAEISVRIGEKQLVQIDILESSLPDNDTMNDGDIEISGDSLVVVGDQTLNGVVEANSLISANGSDLSYSVNEDVFMQKDAGASTSNTASLRLGSRSKPNRAPIFLLTGKTFSQYGYDATGLSSLESQRVTVVDSHQSSAGYSMNFKAKDAQDTQSIDSTLSIDYNESIENMQLKMHLYPQAVGGRLFEVDNHLRISLEPDNRLNVQITNQTNSLDTVQMMSNPIIQNEWTELDLIVKKGKIELWLDETSYELSFPENWIPASSNSLIWGGGYSGYLSDVSLFDLGAEPLLVFPNGEEEIAVLLEPGDSTQVKITSLGNLSYSPQFNRLRGHLVSLEINEEEYVVDVITTDEYIRAASLLLDTLEQNITWSDFKTTYRNYVIDDITPLLEHVLAMQINHNGSGYTEINALTALLAVMRATPDSNPVRDTLADVYSNFLLDQSNDYLLAALSQHLYRQIEPAFRGASIDLDTIALPLTVLNEMVSASPVAASRLADTITSEAGFKTWMDFLSLPAQGWVGVEPPIPPLELGCDDSLPKLSDLIEGAVDLPLISCRLTGIKAADVVNALWDDFELTTGVEEIPLALRELLEILPYSNAAIRQNLFADIGSDDAAFFNLSPVKSASANPLIRVGVQILTRPRTVFKIVVGKTGIGQLNKALRNYVVGSNSRVHPLLMASAVAYLGKSIYECEGERCKVDFPNAKTVYAGLLAKSAAQPSGLLSGSDLDDDDGELGCLIDFSGHGANFELWAAAHYHARYDILEQPEHQLMGMQVQMIQGIRRPNDINQKPADWNRLSTSKSTLKEADKYIRYADLQLAGDEGGKPVLVELKSYPVKDASYDNRDSMNRYVVPRKVVTAITPFWNADKNQRLATKLDKDGNPVKGDNGEIVKELRKTNTTMHRQILLDAMMTTEQLNEEGNRVTQAEDFMWLFQDWRTQTVKSRKNGQNIKQLNKSVGVSLARARVKPSVKSNNDDNSSALDHLKNRLSRLGGKSKDGRTLTAYNLGLNNLPSSSDSSALLNKIRDVGDGGFGDRIKSFDLWGTFTDADKDAVLTALGINPNSKVGKALKSEFQEEVETVLQIQEDVTEALGIDVVLNSLQDAEDKIEVIKKEIAQKIDDAADKYTPKQIKEIKRNAEKYINRKAEELGDSTARFTEKLAEKLGAEFQCL